MKISNQLMGYVLVMMMALSCGNGRADDFDYGRVENGVYLNDFFGIQIKLPEAWIVQSREQTQQISEIGKELMAGDDNILKTQIEASEVNTANLLAVFQYELGASVEFNPSIMIVAENVSIIPGVKNGSDYLFHARRMIMQGQVEYSYLTENFNKEIIGESEFYFMDAYINYMGIEIKQRYYSTILKGFSLNLIISYADEEQKEILENSIYTMTFKK